MVELFSPTYDEATRTATYEVAVLEEWEESLGVGFHQTPADLAAFGERFGAAHLFIDDCADAPIACRVGEGSTWVGEFARQGYCYNFPVCVPCDPYYHSEPSINATWEFWQGQCNSTFSACGGQCRATPG